MKSIYLEIINTDTKNVIRRKDITIKSPKSAQYLKTKWIAEFTDSFWETHRVNILATQESLNIVDDSLQELN